MDAGILTTVLNQLAGRLSLGYARILPDALVLMRYLVAIVIIGQESGRNHRLKTCRWSIGARMCVAE